MEEVSTDTLELANQIAQLTPDLFFDDCGSESSAPIRPFFAEADLSELTPESFAAIFSLRPDDPADQIEKFERAGQTLTNFVNNHQGFGLEAKAYQLVALLQQNLQELSLIILGEAGHGDLPAEHHTFVAGIGRDGCLAGFRTFVTWT